MSVKINPYGASNSAKELAIYLGAKRLLDARRSRYVGRPQDVIINWGKGRGNVGRARQINKLENVQLASNKLSTFDALKEANVSIPVYDTDCSWADDSTIVVARTDLYGHSGKGIVVGQPNELPYAPLYVEYIEKKYEYRAIVVGDSVVDFKQKKKRLSERDGEGNVIEDTRIEHDPHVWNLNGGYIFAREGVRHPDTIDELAVKAVKALGLDFGAVDIIEDDEGRLYVLEINTAFGLEGTTIELVGEAIKGLI